MSLRWDMGLGQEVGRWVGDGYRFGERDGMRLGDEFEGEMGWE